LTPELLDYFFNVRTDVFSKLSDRKKCLLHRIYDLPAYRAILPVVSDDTRNEKGRRRHRRFSVRCPGVFSVVAPEGKEMKYDLQIVQLSRYGFQAHTLVYVPINVWGDVRIQLGPSEISRVKALATRESGDGAAHFGFVMGEPDVVWRKFVNALYSGSTHADLEDATRFMTDR